MVFTTAGLERPTISCVRDVAEWLERLTANAEVATVLGSIPASSDTVESEGAADEAVSNKVHKFKKSKKSCANSVNVSILL